jgi:sulfofructose kinase
MRTIDVLCVGHAAYDVTMSAHHHPAANEKMQADALQCCGGGPAANAAVCVARLGGASAFCGYLGHDLFGDAHVGELKAEGVDCSLLVRGTHPSPLSTILAKPDGTRSVVNYKGETPWLDPDAVVMDGIRPRVLLLDGHEPNLSLELVDWADAEGIPTLLDAGSVHDGSLRLANKVTCLAASERFARDWCGCENMQQAVVKLGEIAPQAIITLGEQGLLWSLDREIGSMPAFEVDVVDSTGAGDAFHGALALAMARGMEWQERLRFASAVGALTCTRLGARMALPTAEELQGLLDS